MRSSKRLQGSIYPAFYVWSSRALLALLFFAILTLWVPQRWALSLFQSGILALAIAWVVRMMWKPYRLHVAAVMIPLAGVLIWGMVQLGTGRSVYRWDTWNAILNWGVSLVILILSYQLFLHAEIRRRFLRGVLIFGFLLSILSTLQMLTTTNVFWLFPSGYPNLVAGPFVSRNLYAAFMELIVPLAVFESLMNPREAVIHIFMTALIFASVIAASSRAGAILLTCEIVAVLALSLARGRITVRRFGAVTAVFTCVCILLIGILGWQEMANHFRMPNSSERRPELWQSSWQMFRERPVWGFGLGTWADVYPAYALYDDGMRANQAHNDWLEWAVEGGAPAVLMFAALAALCLRPAIRSLWGIGVIAILIHAFVDYPLQQKPALAAWVFVFIAAVTSASKVPWHSRQEVLPAVSLESLPG